MTIIEQVKTDLTSLGLRPQKMRGQNFLIDAGVLNKIVAIANVRKGEQVLEIGPGLGILTAALLERGAEVTAVEVDPQLAIVLERKFGNKIRLVVDNVLSLNFQNLFGGEKYRIVANIPYNISSTLLLKLLDDERPPITATLLVQKEVAERIVAKPPKFNVLALHAQLAAHPTKSLIVSKSAFWPQPKVESAVLNLEFNAKVSPVEIKRVVSLAHQAFSCPRKKIMNTLSGEVGSFERCDLSGNERPAELSLENWHCLARRV